MRSRKIIDKEEIKKEIKIDQQQNESVPIKELNERSITKESTENKFEKANLKGKSIIARKLKEKTSIVQMKEVLNNKNTENLETETTLDEKLQEKANTLEIKEIKNPCKNSNFFKKSFSGSEDSSESDNEKAFNKSSTNSLAKKMDQKPLHKSYIKTKNPKSTEDVINKKRTSQYFKMNGIFDESAKAIPLLRKNGTINISFSERAFPTPARESSHDKEQEVCCIQL